MAPEPGAGEAAGAGPPAPTTLVDYLRAAAAWLRRHGSPSPRLEAEVLLAHLLGLPRLGLYLQHDRPLTSAEREGYRTLLRERGRGVPVAHLTGEKEFFSLAFAVSAAVLIPRPESETLVSACLEVVPGGAEGLFADVGTGSGCLAVALAVHRPGLRGFALDRAAAALAVAAGNLRRHGVDNRVEAVAGDLLAPLLERGLAGGLDLVLSNPPYVERGDPRLDPAVARHEPPEALHPGPEGLAGLWTRLLSQAAVLLKPGGWLALEVGAGQAGRLAELLDAAGGWAAASLLPDLAGVERVVRTRRA